MQLSESITLSQAAKLAGVSKRTLQSHMRAGTAPPFERFGRELAFSPASVLSWKERHFPGDGPRRGRKGR